MRTSATGFILAACAASWACTPSNAMSVANALTPSPTVSHVVTIDVAEINGPYSFYPNPATLRSDQVVLWHNSDSVTHHLVFDDGSVDTGTLAPGTLSQPMTIGAGSHGYHCTIHPAMVGTVRE